ncbi:MAG: hypothetical protein E2593_12010 [Stenotrophomonas sp.]|nr:hypothetical protein [Stenotrophomonas sp.]
MSEKIDVLAALDAALHRLWDSVPVRQVWTMEQLDADEQLKEARAAVAELIEAAEILRMLATSHEEFPDWPAGWSWLRIDSAISRVRGAA